LRSAPLLVAVALGLTSACSLLIGGEADEVSCAQEGRLGPPACDPGFSCQDGVCRAAPSLADGQGGQAGQSATLGGAGGGVGGDVGGAPVGVGTGAAGEGEWRH
jgi:hypothetical protein